MQMDGHQELVGERSVPDKLLKEYYQENAKTKQELIEHVRLPETEEMKQAIEVVKKDLMRLYAEAGVDLDESRLAAKIHFVASENLGRPGFVSLGLTDVFGNVVVLVDDPNKLSLRDFAILHHELHHYLGRVVVDPVANGFIQAGHQTMTYSGLIRGQALEEGIVQMLALQFVIKSDDSFMKAMRAREVEENAPSTIREGLYVLENPEAKMRRLVSGGISKIYELSEQVLCNLADMEYRKIEEQERKLVSLLLKSRVFPKTRRQLIEYVNGLYPAEWRIGQRLFTGRFEARDLLNLVELTG